MPNVLPTIPNDPPQGIQALLDKVYLWNPDVSNELIEKVNALLVKLGDAIGAIRPYNEMVAPINQYEPCYYGDGVYVAKNDLAERAEEFNEEDWILIARKEITADEIHINFAGQDDTVQNAIDTLKTDQDELGDQVSAIEEKIPESASETNQLVTKDEVASGYLPLAGGTMTGTVEFEYGKRIVFDKGPGIGEGGDVFFEHKGSAQGLGIGYVARNDDGVAYAYDTNFWFKVSRGLTTEFYSTKVAATLGRSGNKWATIYVTRMNNGADLSVPTEGGTLARVEDVNAIGGAGTAGQVLTKTDEGMAWQDASGGTSVTIRNWA